MNTPLEILAAYHKGEISLSECWERLKIVRKPRPHDEPELKAPPSKVYEPVNDGELKAIEFLQRVHFGASNSAKRFAHQVKDAKELTLRQKEYLRLLVWKYRRQIWRKDYDARAKAYLQRMNT